ncbi:hypothetical protein LIS82_22085 [Cytobacillus solani]|uniref:hypothetical protein n=1 Tax=Cytobacillus solani TaxID=1637975 RepID=UPI000A819E24|nr:hypothetical protein [Cytobacillus solani]USK54226.1 hypothetical protein LIS82_22085 [Cytobacillus solani]
MPVPQRANLREAHEIIVKNRLVEGKRGLPKYIVINTDEVIEILKRHGHWG